MWQSSLFRGRWDELSNIQTLHKYVILFSLISRCGLTHLIETLNFCINYINLLVQLVLRYTCDRQTLLWPRKVKSRVTRMKVFCDTIMRSFILYSKSTYQSNISVHKCMRSLQHRLFLNWVRSDTIVFIRIYSNSTRDVC